MFNTMRSTYTTPPVQRYPVLSEQKVRTEVVLGSPSANCGGVGICRVMAYGEGVGVACPKTEAWLSLTEEGRLRFEFQKSSMEGRFMRRHFRWMLFQVFEAYVVPFRLLGGMKIEQRTIQPGIYQVWEVGDSLIVDF